MKAVGDISVRQFIQEYLIDDIGEVVKKHPYFAFLLISVGIEFIGKCQNDHDWDDYKIISPHDNFENGLKFKPLKAYANKNLYQDLRNGLAHALLIKNNLNLSDKNANNSLSSDEFYDRFKEACKLVLNATKRADGRTFTSDNIEIKKDLDSTFFNISDETNTNGECSSITALTNTILT